MGNSVSINKSKNDSKNANHLIPRRGSNGSVHALVLWLRAMVLSCMDFRLLDDIVYFMNKGGYNNNYDQFILAGSSLGVNQTKYPTWCTLWETHLDLAQKLHHIEEIICIDHVAYRLFYPDMKPEEERDYHIKNMNQFEEKMKKSHPNLKVSSYFMHLDGSCECLHGDYAVECQAPGDDSNVTAAPSID
eukprot:gene5077-7084_t